MESSARNDADSLHQQAVACWFGEGVTTDKSKAIELWQKAAEQGYKKAQYNLGIAFDLGKGVTRDTKEAARWFCKAAEQGYAPAQFELGHLYLCDDEELHYSGEIISLFRKAAAGGVGEGMYWLGRCYQAGAGVDQDDVEAKRWFDLAQNHKAHIHESREHDA